MQAVNSRKAISEYANTVIEDWVSVNVSQQHQMLEWTRRLGVTEPELKAAVMAVGPSISAICWHLGLQVLGGSHALPACSSDFWRDPDARKLCEVMARLNMSVYSCDDLRDELLLVSAKVSKAICSGHLKLDYAPPEDGTVSIPAIDHAHYVQALLYWCIRLEATVPMMLEACCRMDDFPTIAETQRMFRRMNREERSCQTDLASLPPEPG